MRGEKLCMTNLLEDALVGLNVVDADVEAVLCQTRGYCFTTVSQVIQREPMFHYKRSRAAFRSDRSSRRERPYIPRDPPVMIAVGAPSCGAALVGAAEKHRMACGRAKALTVARRATGRDNGLSEGILGYWDTTTTKQEGGSERLQVDRQGKNNYYGGREVAMPLLFIYFQKTT